MKLRETQDQDPKLRIAIRSKNEFSDPIELRNKFKYLTDLENRVA